jgi:hypothetical protein
MSGCSHFDRASASAESRFSEARQCPKNYDSAVIINNSGMADRADIFLCKPVTDYGTR